MALPAQSAKRPLRSDDIYRVRDVHDPQRSPDGKWVAYTVSSVDTARDRNTSDLWMVSWDGTQQRQLTHTPESESSPQWSPDGKWLSFLSSRDGGDGSQLWLLDRNGGEARRVSDVRWRHRGLRVVSRFEASRLRGQRSRADEQSAGRTKKPIVIDRLHFKSDPGGYVLDDHDHLALFDLGTQKLEALTSGTHDETDPVWSPDGTRHGLRQQARGRRSGSPARTTTSSSCRPSPAPRSRV